MKIVLFGGTTEGRILARALTGLGHEVTVSVATPVGAEGLEDLDVRVGRLDRFGMSPLLQDCDLCVDASHPYARALRETVRTACRQAQVPLRRVSRPKSPARGCVELETAAEAAAYLSGRAGNVLLTTGAKELSSFSVLDPARLYARVLPTHESLTACETLGLPHRNILALWGPFSQEFNAAILRQYAIRWLVTKDGGEAGGFPEKCAAARQTGTRVLLLRRPEDFGQTPTEFLQTLQEGGPL